MSHLERNFKKMLKPVEESIYILNKLNYKIQNSVITIVDKCVEHNIDEDSAQSLFYYIMDLGLILTVSYLDELNKFFYKAVKIEKGESYSKDLMKILKTYKSVIEKRFPDLRDFRNNYLAHNMRIDKQNYKNVVLDGDLRKYKVPQNTHDYIFLTNCIKNINILILYFFSNALTEAQNYQVSTFNNLPLLAPQFLTVESIQLELKKINEVIDKQIQDFEQTFGQVDI